MMRISVLRRCAVEPSALSRITIVGGGLMGGGIAEVALYSKSKYNVLVLEADEARAAAARASLEKNIRAYFTRQREKGKTPEERQVDVDGAVVDAMNRVKHTAVAAHAVEGTDLVVEAIAESIDAKLALWSKLDPLAPKAAVFATNTSSLSVAQQAAATSRPDRFGGLHFFSPVPRMPLVEVVRTDTTSEATAETLKKFSVAVGKRPIMVRDTKGFIVNRLLVPYLLESARLVDRGVASVEDVDAAMRLGAGHPMGPFALMDNIGLDVVDGIVTAWAKEEPGNPLFAPSEGVSKLVKAGKLGKKSKEGFYKY